MLFRSAKYEMEIGDDEFQTAYVDLDDVSLDDWIFKAHGFRSNFLGLCQSRKKTIKIARGLTGKELKTTLLHEMIHAYEDLLAMKYREWLLVFWYEKLKQKLGKRQLDRYIDMSTHDVLHAKWHGVFFLLKSLELDLRLRWEHGTVFSYGRVEQFT